MPMKSLLYLILSRRLARHLSSTAKVVELTALSAMPTNGSKLARSSTSALIRLSTPTETSAARLLIDPDALLELARKTTASVASPTVSMAPGPAKSAVPSPSLTAVS